MFCVYHTPNASERATALVAIITEDTVPREECILTQATELQLEPVSSCVACFPSPHPTTGKTFAATVTPQEVTYLLSVYSTIFIYRGGGSDTPFSPRPPPLLDPSEFPAPPSFSLSLLPPSHWPLQLPVKGRCISLLFSDFPLFWPRESWTRTLMRSAIRRGGAHILDTPARLAVGWRRRCSGETMCRVRKVQYERNTRDALFFYETEHARDLARARAARAWQGSPGSNSAGVPLRASEA